MELRLDRLLADLRTRPAELLSAIDSDPLLIRRESQGLVLANASQALYTPQHQHQLYAKGIVYRRNPYRLVSLPLIKIYNIGERNVTVPDLIELGQEPGVHIRFLRKVDGSLIQVFRAEGRVWFTTRGMLEGARGRAADDEERLGDFDFLGEARALARAKYPRLLEDPEVLAGRTLLFELIHPRARKVTCYGDRADLILLGGFDHERFRYLPYPEVLELGRNHDLHVVDALTPPGERLDEQIENLLADLAGTDQEGSVVHFECNSEVIYRVKVKSPDYLQLMRLMAFCTYERTVEILDANPALCTWSDLETYLKELGRQYVPEEVLDFYRGHYNTFQNYLSDCERLRQWALRSCAEVEGRIGGREGRSAAEFRKAFAALAVTYPGASLLFAALDGRLDLNRLRKSVRTPEEARALLAKVEVGTPS